MAPAPQAILGGTFDPVHCAHLAMGRAALEILGAARVTWMPTGRPGYRNPPEASARHRLAMLGIALAGEPRYAIDARELEPQASAYTVDTLYALRAALGPACPLVLLVGADQFVRLDGWHRWRALFDHAHLAVFARTDPGQAASPAVSDEARARTDHPGGRWRTEPAGRVIEVPMPPVDVSATRLRAQLRRGAVPADALPAGVLDYIRAHGLYGTAATITSRS